MNYNVRLTKFEQTRITSRIEPPRRLEPQFLCGLKIFAIQICKLEPNVFLVYLSGNTKKPIEKILDRPKTSAGIMEKIIEKFLNLPEDINGSIRAVDLVQISNAVSFRALLLAVICY